MNYEIIYITDNNELIKDIESHENLPNALSALASNKHVIHLAYREIIETDFGAYTSEIKIWCKGSMLEIARRVENL